MERPKIKELKNTYANNGFCLRHIGGKLFVILGIYHNHKTAIRLKRDGYSCVPLYEQGVFIIQKGVKDDNK